MPRLAPVIRTVLFSMFISTSTRTTAARPGGIRREIGRELGGLVGDEGSGCREHPGAVPVVSNADDSTAYDSEAESVIRRPTLLRCAQHDDRVLAVDFAGHHAP